MTQKLTSELDTFLLLRLQLLLGLLSVFTEHFDELLALLYDLLVSFTAAHLVLDLERSRVLLHVFLYVLHTS